MRITMEAEMVGEILEGMEVEMEGAEIDLLNANLQIYCQIS
jgi:hypothetical protein